MSLNHIKLNHQLLTDLYQDSLVETNTSNTINTHTSNINNVNKANAATNNNTDEIDTGIANYSTGLTNTTKKSVKARPLLKYLGNNKRNILIIVNNDSVPFLEESEVVFLTNILSACRLSMADVAILNKNKADHEALLSSMDQLESKQVLMFGTGPLSIGLPLNFPHFQIQPYDKRVYLFIPAFSALEKDKALKTKLWNALKILFDLS